MSAVVFDTASSGHIDVIYTSLNPGQAIDASTVTDDQPEFSLDGPAVNLVVNGHATQLDSRTFRYSFTGNLVTGLLDNSVNVQFIAGSVSDTAGCGARRGNADVRHLLRAAHRAAAADEHPAQPERERGRQREHARRARLHRRQVRRLAADRRREHQRRRDQPHRRLTRTR